MRRKYTFIYNKIYTTMFIGRAVVVLSLPNMRKKYTFIYNKIYKDVHRTSTPLPSKLCSLVYLSAAIYVQFYAAAKSVCILLYDASKLRQWSTQTEKVKTVKHSTRGSKTILQTASRLNVFLSFPVSFFFGVRCELLVSFVEQFHCYKLNRPYWHTIQWFAWDKKMDDKWNFVRWYILWQEAHTDQSGAKSENPRIPDYRTDTNWISCKIDPPFVYTDLIFTSISKIS